MLYIFLSTNLQPSRPDTLKAIISINIRKQIHLPPFLGEELSDLPQPTHHSRAKKFSRIHNHCYHIIPYSFDIYRFLQHFRRESMLMFVQDIFRTRYVEIFNTKAKTAELLSSRASENTHTPLVPAAVTTSDLCWTTISQQHNSLWLSGARERESEISTLFKMLHRVHLCGSFHSRLFLRLK